MSEEKAKKAEKKPATNDAAAEQKPDYSNKQKKQVWTMARCKKLARRYVNEQEWQAGSPSSYKAAKAHGWIKECATLFVKNTGNTNKKLPKSA